MNAGGGFGSAPIRRLLPGYRFVPTDEQVMVHLRHRIDHGAALMPEMREVSLYRHHPQALAETHPRIGDNAWYFFTLLNRKHPNGSKPDRLAGGGFWKAVLTEKAVATKEGAVVGQMQTLAYYFGAGKAAGKTRWMMHEYRTKEWDFGELVLCRIYPKEERAMVNLRRRGKGGGGGGGGGVDSGEEEEEINGGVVNRVGFCTDLLHRRIHAKANLAVNEGSSSQVMNGGDSALVIHHERSSNANQLQLQKFSGRGDYKGKSVMNGEDLPQLIHHDCGSSYANTVAAAAERQQFPNCYGRSVMNGEDLPQLIHYDYGSRSVNPAAEAALALQQFPNCSEREDYSWKSAMNGGDLPQLIHHDCCGGSVNPLAEAAPQQFPNCSVREDYTWKSVMNGGDLPQLIHHEHSSSVNPAAEAAPQQFPKFPENDDYWKSVLNGEDSPQLIRHDHSGKVNPEAAVQQFPNLPENDDYWSSVLNGEDSPQLIHRDCKSSVNPAAEASPQQIPKYPENDDYWRSVLNGEDSPQLNHHDPTAAPPLRQFPNISELADYLFKSLTDEGDLPQLIHHDQSSNANPAAQQFPNFPEKEDNSSWRSATNGGDSSQKIHGDLNNSNSNVNPAASAPINQQEFPSAAAAAAADAGGIEQLCGNESRDEEGEYMRMLTCPDPPPSLLPALAPAMPDISLSHYYGFPFY